MCGNKRKKRKKKEKVSCSVAETEEAGGRHFCSKTSSFQLCVLVCFSEIPPLCPHFHLLVLLLLLFEQFVDLPLDHGGVLGDDAMLVEARQQQQEAHCRRRKGKTQDVKQRLQRVKSPTRL